MLSRSTAASAKAVTVPDEAANNAFDRPSSWKSHQTRAQDLAPTLQQKRLLLRTWMVEAPCSSSKVFFTHAPDRTTDCQRPHSFDKLWNRDSNPTLGALSELHSPPGHPCAADSNQLRRQNLFQRLPFQMLSQPMTNASLSLETPDDIAPSSQTVD